MWYEPSNGIVTKPSNSSLTKLQYEKLVQETWSRYLRIPGKISASKADWPLLKTTEMVWRYDNSIFSAGICCIALPNSHPLIWRRQRVLSGWNIDYFNHVKHHKGYGALWWVSENMFERTVFKEARIDSEKKSGRRDKSKRLLVPLQTRDGQTKNESATTLFLCNAINQFSSRTSGNQGNWRQHELETMRYDFYRMISYRYYSSKPLLVGKN